MKEIVIRRLQLLNFKGIRNLTVDFDEAETNIYGANGVGKTTIFDAFVWLLFGKDTNDRKDFNIKTIGKNGKAIPRLPHEVTGWIEVNGQEITLKKCYTEVWQKKRGQAVETFQGHQVECFFNEVPCSVTEYNRKVAEICDAQVFKLITNPAYFTSQSKATQREMLFRLAGEISDSEILKAYPEFTELVGMLTGKTLDEFRREVACKKKTIKDRIENIPARIDEVKRTIPEERDWSAVARTITDAETRIAELEAQVEDRSKVYNEMAKHKQEVARALSDVQGRISRRRSDLVGSLLADYNEARRQHETAVSKVESLTHDRRVKNLTLQRLETDLAQANAQLDTLRAEFQAIKADVFTAPDPESFICPTCKRPLEAEDVDAEIERLRKAFNAHQSDRKAANKARGLEVKGQAESKSEEIRTIKADIFAIDTMIASIQDTVVYKTEPAKPNEDAVLAKDADLMTLIGEATRLQQELEQEAPAPDTSDLKDAIREQRNIISNARLTLSERERIAASNERISQLEKEYQESQAELAELEGLEFQMLQFSKARIEKIESRINGLFTLVKFRMFETQINGGEVETCEATVDGVPFSDLNSASRVNAGLDIINAICEKEGIIAPIFIDNRESVSDIIRTKAQLVNLVVAPDCKTIQIG